MAILYLIPFTKLPYLNRYQHRKKILTFRFLLYHCFQQKNKTHLIKKDKYIQQGRTNIILTYLFSLNAGIHVWLLYIYKFSNSTHLFENYSGICPILWEILLENSFRAGEENNYTERFSLIYQFFPACSKPEISQLCTLIYTKYYWFFVVSLLYSFTEHIQFLFIF